MRSKLKRKLFKYYREPYLIKIDQFNYSSINYNNNIFKNFVKFILNLFIFKNKKIVIKSKITDHQIDNGLVRSSNCFSMIGTKRLRNIKILLEDIIKNNIDGDLIEAGIWKGGVLIYMRACLLAYDIEKSLWSRFF